MRLSLRWARAEWGKSIAPPTRGDLSWLNTSHARALSQDGQTLLFSETALGTNYAVCLRKTDGSPVVRLGEGWPADLSADGKWVVAVVQSLPPKLLVYPTGAGETRQLERGAIEHYATAQWFHDGKSVLISGNEPGQGTRFYVQELGGAPKPVTPEGTRDGLLSADGKLVLARGPDGKHFLYPIAAGTTGGVALFQEFAPADRTGLLSLREIFVTDDLRSYAYTAYYQVSSLFVSDGGE